MSVLTVVISVIHYSKKIFPLNIHSQLILRAGEHVKVDLHIMRSTAQPVVTVK